MKMPRIYYGVLVVFCIVTFVIGMASAADMGHPAVHNMSIRGSGYMGAKQANITPQHQFITKLEQRGINGTLLKSAAQNGNKTAMKSWPDTYCQLNRTNATYRAMRPHADQGNVTLQQQFITRIEQQGVDVTGLKAAFGKGDTTAVKTWFDAYRKAHLDEMPARAMRGQPASQNR
jgi:hypothetical protein